MSSYKANDLCEAIGSPSLDTLRLQRCGVNSLNGTQISTNLRVVKLDSCSKLESIDALYESRETLHGLVIENCKNIRDYSVLSKLKQLTRLSIIGTGSIPTVSFLEHMPNLKTLILGVDVMDGDLSFCDRVEDVTIYPNRRHFNRKDEDFHKTPRAETIWGDEGIEPWRQHVMR